MSEENERGTLHKLRRQAAAWGTFRRETTLRGALDTLELIGRADLADVLRMAYLHEAEKPRHSIAEPAQAAPDARAHVAREAVIQAEAPRDEDKGGTCPVTHALDLVTKLGTWLALHHAHSTALGYCITPPATPHEHDPMIGVIEQLSAWQRTSLLLALAPVADGLMIKAAATTRATAVEQDRAARVKA